MGEIVSRTATVAALSREGRNSDTAQLQAQGHYQNLLYGNDVG
jgi:hypothetical protein